MNNPKFTTLKAIYINCTLKKSPRKSHTKGLMDVSMAIMKREGVAVDEIRFIDLIKDLEAVYGCEFQLVAVTNARFSGSLPMDDFDTVIQILSSSLHLRIYQNGNKVIVK